MCILTFNAMFNILEIKTFDTEQDAILYIWKIGYGDRNYKIEKI